MNCDIQELKEKLNKRLLTESLASDNVIKLSQELDKLILEYYKSNFPAHLKSNLRRR